MTIDVGTYDEDYDDTAELEHARRLFPKITFSDVEKRAEDYDPWLIPGLIASSSTLLFGESKIGKSWLVSHLIGALLTGGKFLDVQVLDKPFSVGVCFTDDIGDIEYWERIRGVAPDHDDRVGLYRLGVMREADWNALLRVVLDEGHNILVIDNITQILDGTINDDATMRRCFEGIRKFTHAGIAVVIVGHSSDKKGPNGYKPETPMGNAYVSQAVRWLGFVRKTKNKNLGLRVYGNLGYGSDYTLRPEAGARYTVIGRTDETEKITEVRERETGTLDKNTVMADFIVSHCTELSQRETARRLATEFGGSESSHKTSLSQKILSKMVVKTDGRWMRVVPK